MIDPASAMLALTVGSIARSDKPFKAFTNPEQRSVLVGAPPFGPSPFTRAGRLASTGAGPAKAVKPELIAFGGNYYVFFAGKWLGNDVLLGEPSLTLDYTTSGRLLKAATGTSVAAPFVTHVCALVEHGLKQLSRWQSRPPSANLIRAHGSQCRGAEGIGGVGRCRKGSYRTQAQAFGIRDARCGPRASIDRRPGRAACRR